MINVALLTEFSFKKCFGHVDQIVKREAELGKTHVGIADINNTFGHVQFNKACKKYGIKPIFGVRLNMFTEQRTCNLQHILIAKNSEGLKELYELVKMAYDSFYYIPRLTNSKALRGAKNLAYLSPYYSEKSSEEPNPVEQTGVFLGRGIRYNPETGQRIAINENNYTTPKDREVYQLLAGRNKRGDEYYYNFEDSVHPQYILSGDEHIAEYGDAEAVANTYSFVEEIEASLHTATMVSYSGASSVEQQCKIGKKRRKIEWTQEYEDRYQKEIDLIKEKGYEDYFMIVADVINYAKQHMLVGPSRGSSAGSLVCYLMGITEVDPIPYDLIFERFIDVNRFDLPDIDIDFPDKKRHLVVKYLTDKYGEDKVMTLANISRLKPKSAIGEFAAALGIPKYETEEVKGAIIERSSGDARAAMCVSDTFNTTEPGKEFISKYPAMRLVSCIEGHAGHAGKHAAGVIVSTEKLTTYCGIDSRAQVCMLDKKDAESIGLLKIDCLGLRTLSVLEDAAKGIGMQPRDIYKIPLDDQRTFDLFNNMRLSGIFQFEGYALQSLTRQMGIYEFNDIVAIGALARPGALNSGGASRYVKYRTGVEEPTYINSDHKRITSDTYGITVYQEQMMNIAREVGKLSWADTSDLRRAASKSLGDEFFSKYKEKFIDGAINQSHLTAEEAEDIWNDISHSGSWSFNKSHAVSYGLISYWTAWFKANYPLQFSVASLNNASDSDHVVKLLRDMVKYDNIEYVPVIPEISGPDWSVYDGKLLGGLTNIKGIAAAKAKQIVNARQGKGKMTPSLFKMLENPQTDFDIIFPAEHYWGKLYNDPISYGLSDKPINIEEIEDAGTYTFIGCLADRNLRDLNEYTFLVKRDGQIIEEDNLYLNFTVEDDTDSIICTINRYKFEEYGRAIAESGEVGKSWYLIRGRIRGGWRKIEVEHIVNLFDTLGDLS